jgi:ribosomal protein S8E
MRAKHKAKSYGQTKEEEKKKRRSTAAREPDHDARRCSATTATLLPDDMAQVTIGVGLTNCAADSPV